MDPWCAYILFAQQQEAAQAPMQRRMQELTEPSPAPPAPAQASPAQPQAARRAPLPPPPLTPLPGSGRICRR